MKAFKTPSNLRWTTTQTMVVSLILAIVAFLLLRFLKIKGYIQPTFTQSEPASDSSFGEFADLLSVITVFVALLFPSLVLFCWSIIDRMRPRPGSRAFQDNELGEFKKAFEADRRAISAIMVPAHSAKAKPAKTSRKVDFGDSLLVVPKPDYLALAQFVGKPRRRLSFRDPSKNEFEKDILIITGEPGAGKSVLLQELHASLSLGVEQGFHSFVPLIIFARDLTKRLLTQASQDTETPMRTLLTDCYERRFESDSAEKDLIFLRNLVSSDWNETDILVIIDGLDEIAQRSAYEEIQKELARIILADLKSGSKAVHHYILSCRTDEDLELFLGAETLHLRGLADGQREEFCRVLVGSGNLDKQLKSELEQALYSPRLTPAHVFRRNPYFLALLVKHLIEDQDRVRDQTINFDYLMRKYLEREAIRPYASVDTDGYLTVEERRVLFNELEKVSRACLQYLAFRSASTARLGALYDETSIDEGLIRGFLEILEEHADSNSTDLWGTIRKAVDHIGSAENNFRITPESMQKLGLTKFLHENDIWLLKDLAKKLRESGRLNSQILFEALGTIPYKGILETEEWYLQLTSRFLTTVETMTLTNKHSLAVLLFLRSIVSAHVLRILLVNNSQAAVSIRFRHRRLAEYYAACYLRDRWLSVEGSIDFTPWLGPILNLTCALEGQECKVLRKLVDRMMQPPEEPYFIWRYSVEAVLEASFFAEPGYEYERAIKDVLRFIISTLWRLGSYDEDLKQGKPENKQESETESAQPLDAITEIAALRTLIQYARLKDTIKLMPVLEADTIERFYEYEATVPEVWTSQVMAARLSIEALADKRYSLRSHMSRLWELVQQPALILSDDPNNPLRNFAGLRKFVFSTTMLSEFLLTLIMIALIIVPFFYIHKLLQVEDRVVLTNTTILFVLTLMTRIFFRYVAWQQSRVEAVSYGALVWSGIGVLTNGIRNLARGEVKLNWRLLIKQPSDIIKAVLAVVVVFALIIGIQALARRIHTDSQFTPCPEINDLKNSIISRYEDLKKRPDLDLKAVQLEIREDLEKLRQANEKQRCGYKTIEGWTLAEHRLADWLAIYDSRFVPPQSENVQTITPEEANEFSTIRSSPMPENPEPTIIGSFKAIYRSWEANKIIETEKRIYSQIIQARRQGVGLPKGAEYSPLAICDKVEEAREKGEGIFAANLFLDELRRIVEADESASAELRSRAKKTVVYCIVTIIILTMIILSIRLDRRRRRDNKDLAIINKISDVASLCEILLKKNHSERVRRQALRRIDIIGVTDQEQVKLVEDATSKLMKRHSPTDQAIGLSLANLAQVLSNRLRHRVSDMEIRKAAGQ